MSLLIQLPAAVEARVAQEAKLQGKAPEEIVRDLVERMFSEVPTSDNGVDETLPRTGADLLAAWEKDQALGAFQKEPEDFAQRLRETVWKWER